jgi:hypothetical protein
LTASTSIKVYVDDDLALPGPTLSVEPGQLGWHFGEGDTASQNATLTIANVGSGNFNWTASTPAPWLTLSANQGTTPAEITVTANPTQIAGGESISSTIIVTATRDVGQFSVILGTATIPAHAVFGNAYVVELPTDHHPNDLPIPHEGPGILLPSVRK